MSEERQVTDYKAEAERLSTSFDRAPWDNHVASFAAALEAAEKRGMERAADEAYAVACEDDIECSWWKLRDDIRRRCGLPPMPEEEDE